MKAACIIEGCGKPRLARGWCPKHYQRWLKHGDPLTTETNYPDRGDTLKWIDEHLSYQGADCLVWPFYRNNDGYACLRVDRKNISVSRYICIKVNGQPPTPEHEAAHNCGNGHEGCAAPNHVRWATKLENEADKLIHGTRLLRNKRMQVAA